MALFGSGSVKLPKMVRIRPGEFVMGSPEGEGTDDERPQHRVRIKYPFEVSKYPVTFAEWDSAVENGLEGFEPYEYPNDLGWGRDKEPVINASWDDAQAYIEWLGAHTGKTFRLLSEAEWEYCCRAGTTTAYSFGNEIRRRQANFNFTQTVRVNRFVSNRFGLAGMHGNVWEWCEDCWNENYDNAPADGSALLKGDCDRRVLRGGSWETGPEELRSASRSWGMRTDQDSGIGFRIACTL